MKNRTCNRACAICAAVAVLVIAILLPLPEGLTPEGKNAIGLLLACVILWVTQAFPLYFTCLLGFVAMPYLGFMSLSELWPSFGSMTLFFVVASYGISVGLLKTTIPQRIIRFVLRHSLGGKSTRVIYGFCAATAVVSSIISDIPAALIFVEVSTSLLTIAGIQKGDDNDFAKALMIAVPLGSAIGGLATPAGNTINLLVMTGLEQFCGIQVTFLGWARMGIPTAVIGVCLICLGLRIGFKPEPLSDEVIMEADKKLGDLGRMSATDIKYLVIMCVVLICWMAGSWVPALNMATVAIAGVTVMMLPGIEIFDGEEFVKNVGWDVVVLVGCILALGNGIQSTGGVSWLISGLTGYVAGFPAILTYLLVSVVGCLLHAVLPIAGCVYAIGFLPVMELASAGGVNLLVAAFIFAIWVNVTFLLPTDTIIIFSYRQGYFSASDLFKRGVLITILFLIASVTIVPLIV